MFCFTLVTTDNFDYATSTAESLFERIFLRPQHYKTEALQKGVRRDMFYTIKADLFNETTADDNGVYLNSRSNKKQYAIETNEGKVTNIKTVHQTPDGRLYYNVRNGKNYSVAYVNKENFFTLERYYRQNKSNQFLKRLIVTIKCHTDNLYCSYIGVPHSLDNKNCDKVEILPHGNSKKEDANLYIRTSQKIMDRERALLAAGHPVQYVYDKLLDESSGLLKSKSQSSEPRDKRQIYIQNAKRKCKENDKCEDDDDLSDLLLRQLKSTDVVESIVIKKNCYFYFVATEKQTNDISTVCCSGNDVSVLGIGYILTIYLQF